MGYGIAATAAWRCRESGEDGREGYGTPRDEFAELDVEAIETVGDEIATWAAVLHGGKRRLLALIARFHGLNGWVLGGHRTCAHWLSFRTGYSLPTAREYVRVALALEDLPDTAAAMERGALSFCKARALTRIATPETETDLVALAEGCTTAQLEVMARAWRKHSRLEEVERERQRLRDRKLSIFPDDDGMYVLHGRFTPENALSMMRAIEEESDRTRRARRASSEETELAGNRTEAERAAAAARARADALVALVERGLSAPPADAPDAPVTGTRPERYQVILHVDPATLAEDDAPGVAPAAGEPGRCELEDGSRVSYETARRIACDAGIVRVEQDEAGRILDVGRRSRSPTTAIRRAAEIRDRGCRFPGCGLRYTQPHHVHHWADGGPTSLANTLLLCHHHHRLVHEGGWKVAPWPHGCVAFTDPRGQVHVGGEVPKMPEPPEDPGELVETIARHARVNGAEPDAWTASARWKRERDIPAGVLFRATEAGLTAADGKGSARGSEPL